MLKKIAAAFVTAALALGVVALVAGPASAHHNTITATVACAADNSGAYTVTWSVSNSETNKSEEITASSNEAVVPVHTQLGFGETKKFTQTVTSAQDLTLNLTGYWAATNVTTQNSGSISKSQFPTGCITVTPGIDKVHVVCTGPGQQNTPGYTLTPVTGVIYYVNNVETSAGVFHTVTPGQTYHFEAKPVDSRYTLTGQTSGDWTVENPDCTTTVTPVEPVFQDAICTGTAGDTTLPSFTIKPVTGVIYSYTTGTGGNTSAETVIPAGTTKVTLPAGTTDVTVIARGDIANHYQIDGGSVTWKHTYTSAVCKITVTPVQPTFADAVCTAPGQQKDATVTVTGVAHVIVTVTNTTTNVATTYTGNATITVPAGQSVRVTAAVDDATKYQLSEPVGITYTASTKDCTVVTTTVSPTVANQSCTAATSTTVDGSITIPATTGVVYSIGGQVKTAGTYTYAPSNYTVTAAAAPGYVLKGATSFPVTIAAGPCIPKTPNVTPVVTSNNIGCFSDGSYTLKNDTSADAITWTVNGATVAPGTYTVKDNGTVTITAAASSTAYGLTPGAQAIWTIDFQKPTTCDLPTLAMTGSNPTGLLLAADGFLVAGLTLFAIRALRRTRSQQA